MSRFDPEPLTKLADVMHEAEVAMQAFLWAWYRSMGSRCDIEWQDLRAHSTASP